jgi:hypothetical protein
MAMMTAIGLVLMQPGTVAYAQRQVSEAGEAKTDGPKPAGQVKTPQAEKGKTEAIQWADEDQKKRCEGYLLAIRENIVKARDASINGDSCTSASRAKDFLGGVERARAHCPPGFLEKNDIGPRMVKNLNTLHILGKERCQEKPVKETPRPSGPPAKGN